MSNIVVATIRLIHGRRITFTVIVFHTPDSASGSVGVSSPYIDERLKLLKRRINANTRRINITPPDTMMTLGPKPALNDRITTPTMNSPAVIGSGAFMACTLSPRIPIIAGSNVIPTITATNTTRIDPIPNAWNVRSGMINIPSIANTTVSPLNTTARPAVPPAASIAACLSNPRSRSSL